MTAKGGRARAVVIGFTLVEVLLATVLTAVVAAVLGGTLASARAVSERFSAGADAVQLRSLAAELLRTEIELAGRGRSGGDGLAFSLDLSGAGGDVVHVRYIAEADRAEATLVEASFSASRDGRNRWNLYRRPPGGIRQPWLLEVSGLHLVQGRSQEGALLARADLENATNLSAVQVEVRFVTGDPVRFWASTRRAGMTTSPLSWTVR